MIIFLDYQKKKFLEKEETELEQRVSRIEKLKRLPRFEEPLYKRRLTRFCREKLQQGYTEKDVLKATKKVGWREELIKKIMEGLKK